MRYVSWAVLYEGHTDGLYLDALLPRVIRDLVAREGNEVIEIPDGPAVKLGLKTRAIASVVDEACSSREAFDVIFIHADTGGRGQAEGLDNRADAYCNKISEACDWPAERCITITPRHETEAWLLDDPNAVTSALGYNGLPATIGLPADAREAERLVDPKQILKNAILQVSGRRRAQHLETLFPSIGQRQTLTALRQSRSFSDFEGRLRHSLKSMRFLPV